jgi:hypothetical protein
VADLPVDANVLHFLPFPAFLTALHSYGVYQIGDVYARSCVVIGTSGVIFTA